jgi:hypothetical protein
MASRKAVALREAAAVKYAKEEVRVPNPAVGGAAGA